ncbi:Hypothetical_protein [Hexamita inflata]|uniref:Hypothetical_protein n=1 Tax=Hexamita inflata TaxID=28002 RepID=A0AA86RDA2_9EUKA|nr:Hypothetical protein HINF_LOCUS60148 [Hexamita inflata]
MTQYQFQRQNPLYQSQNLSQNRSQFKTRSLNYPWCKNLCNRRKRRESRGIQCFFQRSTSTRTLSRLRTLRTDLGKPLTRTWSNTRSQLKPPFIIRITRKRM